MSRLGMDRVVTCLLMVRSLTKINEKTIFKTDSNVQD